MGLINLVDSAADGADYGFTLDFSMYGTADEIVPQSGQGRAGCRRCPANLAATLYQRTEGAVQVAAVNTLGVSVHS